MECSRKVSKVRKVYHVTLDPFLNTRSKAAEKSFEDGGSPCLNTIPIDGDVQGPRVDELHKRLRLEPDLRRLVVVHDDLVHQNPGFISS
ncbi:hypothetical protein EVAR_9491_1 [Eumeta japonica]|uniref:Uncharacterized protein n=1 Tax=Eumeta variegata TaxID=151549 RepID=A0A4C1U3M6_EUMVA|nr:hypothetical protein EVAR_9491_1 [Eumeta japonica]